MKIMTETTNGFVVSEKDLQLRGPGEVFGNRQSGLPEFAAADLVADAHILEVAQVEAAQLWQKWLAAVARIFGIGELFSSKKQTNNF